MRRSEWPGPENPRRLAKTEIAWASRSEVYELRVEGEPAAIVVTQEHPFWSMDRNAWTPALAGMDRVTMTGPEQADEVLLAVDDQREVIRYVAAENAHIKCAWIGERGKFAIEVEANPIVSFEFNASLNQNGIDSSAHAL